jgi:hypothetical protein
VKITILAKKERKKNYNIIFHLETLTGKLKIIVIGKKKKKRETK